MEMDLALGGIFRRFPGLHLHLSVEEISQSIDRHSGGLATLPVAW
jgi:cytochrome P450